MSFPNSRILPEGHIPLVDVSGSSFEVGEQLACIWRDRLMVDAQQATGKPWWLTWPDLVERHTPHLPDLYRGMAKGLGVKEEQVGERAVPLEAGGCTSFALHPSVTLDGQPICGQTKDTGTSRCLYFQVLRLNVTDGPRALTLTYPGWLFGHGFVEGGCAIFRNSIYADNPGGNLPYFVWGLLALHCRSVEEVMQLTRDRGIDQAAHCAIQDSNGDIIGLENAKGGACFLETEDGIYVHANAIRSESLRGTEKPSSGDFAREDSCRRDDRLRELLVADAGRLTPQLAYRALGDHENFPTSICRHQSQRACTTAAVIAEPTRGRLTVTRGSPCQNWPVTHRLT